MAMYIVVEELPSAGGVQNSCAIRIETFEREDKNSSPENRVAAQKLTHCLTLSTDCMKAELIAGIQ